MLVNASTDEVLQLQREAELAGFRPATLRGVHPSEMRERALSSEPRLTLAHLALALVLVGGGFALGRYLARWRKQKQQPKSVIGGGLDVFAADRAVAR